MKQSRREMIERVSILYYEKNKNQNEIAKEMCISRSYVSQMLNYAKSSGIVRIIINIDEYNLRMIRKEFEFKAKFPKLKQLFIMYSDSDDFTADNIGRFASPYIIDMINEANVIGVNLGSAVEKTINCFETYDFANTSNKKVVQIMGGFNTSSLVLGAHPNELVSKLNTVLNCECYYLNCPAIIDQPYIREALLKENSIKSVMDMWNSIDLAIMGIGVADDRSKLFRLFNDKMKETIKDSKVVSELTINFLDSNGHYVPLLNEHRISIAYEQLKNIKRKVFISYGGYKKNAILAALKGEMVDVLITDSLTIQAIEECMLNVS
jgi:deoxyribonucleoside regulator